MAQPLQSYLRPEGGIGPTVPFDFGAAVRPELGFQNDIEGIWSFRVETDPQVIRRRRGRRDWGRSRRRSDDGVQIRQRENNGGAHRSRKGVYRRLPYA